MDNWIYKQNYSADPFREQQHFADGPTFHIKEETPQTPTEPVTELQRKPLIPEENQTKGPRNIKDVLSDIWRQIVASIIILIIGFFVLNWSAYYQIVMNKYHTFKHGEQQNVLDEIAGTSSTDLKNPLANTSENKSTITSENGTITEEPEIPLINMEIAPTDNRIIIPRIDQNIPIVSVSSENLIKKDFDALEKDMQEALKDGVVHYPGTSYPNQKGNVVITGHSSYFPWDPGRFKDVFALLHDMVKGDIIVVYYEQKKYYYEVTEIKVVMPENIDVLKQTPGDQLTLITCTPIGTNLKRLIVIAKPVTE